MEILNKEDLEFLKELADKIHTQDTFATAKPVFYQIAEPTIIWGMNPDNGSVDVTQICIGDYDADNFVDIEDSEEVKQSLLNYFEDDEDDNIIERIQTLDLTGFINEIIEEIDTLDVPYCLLDGKKVISYHGSFLTYDAAKKHLDSNYYHYNSVGTPYIYTNHNWRNPEMEKLQEIILKFKKIS